MLYHAALQLESEFVYLFAGVRSCYDEGKRMAETLMFVHTYGPSMNIDDGRVVSNFIAQAIL